MVRRIAVCTGLVSVAMAVTYAAGAVWESKPFTEWTDKEVQQVLTESPWAGKGSLTNVSSGGRFMPVPDWKVIVVWQSALPVKQAIMRQAVGSAAITAEQQKALDTAEQAYIIRIVGLPGMYANMATATQIGNSAALLRDGKPPIKANQGGAQLLDKDGRVVDTPAGRGGAPAGAAPAAAGAARRSGGGGGAGFGGAGANDGTTALLVFGFPKTDPITSADKEIEFSATVGPYYLKRKFKVRDMVLKGEPAF
jgi:hypothetical protein